MMPAAPAYDTSAIRAVCSIEPIHNEDAMSFAPHQPMPIISIPQNSTLMTFNSPRSPLELPYNTYNYYTSSNSSQYVRPVVNPCPPSSSNHVFPSPPLESPLSSSPSRHVPVNYLLNGLASQHGIPTILPKPPSTAPRRNLAPPLQKHTLPDFDLIRFNYLNMLSQKTPSNPSVDMPTHSATVPSPVFSVDSTSPMFSDFGDDFLTSPQNEFLTSPIFDNFGGDFSDSSPLDTPLDSFLTTPLFHDVGEPLIAGGEEFSRMDLFGGQDILPVIEQEVKLPPVEKSLSINPSSLTASPARTEDSVFVPPARTARGTGKPRKASAATGTRKNITPESMVPMDAPIQSRRYITPSATSRKEIPATFLKKKRSRSQAFGEDDELEEILPPNATEAEQIEFKRRQNTLAARKSRKRKLEYQQGLESQIEDLQAQLAHWKARAEVSEGVIQANGLSLPA